MMQQFHVLCRRTLKELEQQGGSFSSDSFWHCIFNIIGISMVCAFENIFVFENHHQFWRAKVLWSHIYERYATFWRPSVPQSSSNYFALFDMIISVEASKLPHTCWLQTYNEDKSFVWKFDGQKRWPTQFIVISILQRLLLKHSQKIVVQSV